MSHKFTQVDAFTSEPFKGNPAAVFVLEEDQSDEWMHNVATEMNLSETAFLRQQGEAFGLRWFTPVHEVDLCGHATLASAHALWEGGFLAPESKATFNTRSGQLSAQRKNNFISMDFPAEPCKKVDPPLALQEGLGLEFAFVGQNRFDYLVEVPNEEDLIHLTPDFTKLSQLDLRGIIVTAKSAQYDFISRFFAPRHNINEDPVTGSAHCCLAPYWGEKLDKKELKAFQASKRGGHLNLVVKGDRIELIGQAITVLEGEVRA